MPDCTTCKWSGNASYDYPCSECRPNNPSRSKYEPEMLVPCSPEEAEGTGREKGNPLHYPDSRHGDVISLALNGDIGFCEGNIIKYVTRWRKKGGLEDLYKAKTYLDRLIRFHKNKPEESYRVA